MVESLDTQHESATPAWSILGANYDPEKNSPDPGRLAQIERAASYTSREDTAARSWATQAVIYALELCDPELFSDQQRAAKALSEIAKASHQFRNYSTEKVENLAKDLGLDDRAPILQSLNAILRIIPISPGGEELGSLDIAKVAPDVPGLSERLVQYILIQQEGLGSKLLDAA